MKNCLLFFLPLITAACATPTVQLSANAKNVQMVEYMTPVQKQGYEEVGQVKCQEGMNGKLQSANIISCENALKNQAATLGAEIILLDKDRDWWQGQFGSGCENCVKGKGLAFKKKTESITK